RDRSSEVVTAAVLDEHRNTAGQIHSTRAADFAGAGQLVRQAEVSEEYAGRLHGADNVHVGVVRHHDGVEEVRDVRVSEDRVEAVLQPVGSRAYIPVVVH